MHCKQTTKQALTLRHTSGWNWRLGLGRGLELCRARLPADRQARRQHTLGRLGGPERGLQAARRGCKTRSHNQPVLSLAATFFSDSLSAPIRQDPGTKASSAALALTGQVRGEIRGIRGGCVGDSGWDIGAVWLRRDIGAVGGDVGTVWQSRAEVRAGLWAEVRTGLWAKVRTGLRAGLWAGLSRAG
jgi:hypothetical protein